MDQIPIEDCCEKALSKLIVEGRNEIQVNVLCAEVVVKRDGPYLPKSGPITLILEVVDGRIVKAAIRTKGDWRRDQPYFHEITAFSSGLDGACVRINVRTKQKQDHVALALDILLTDDHSIYRRVFEETNQLIRDPWKLSGSRSKHLQNVNDWLEDLQK